MALTATDEINIATPGASAAALRAALAAQVGYKVQDAGGVVSPGLNIVGGYSGNLIGSDIGSGTVLGGGYSGRENVIGGITTNVNTGTSNTATTGTGADYSVITGGYDNVAAGLMSVISGAHNYTAVASTHGTIGGGSVQKIDAGDYHTIAGGTLNQINTVGGSRGTIGGGSNNVISGSAVARATIAGGSNNTVTGTQGTIGGGYSNAASGAQSTVSGGSSNTASGANSQVTGGDSNTASGDYSVASGVQAVARLQGQRAHSAGRFAAVGDAQASQFIVRRQTTTATPTGLRVDGGAGFLTMPDDTTWAFSGIVVARRTDADNESASWKIEGCIDQNAGTVALVGVPTVTSLGSDGSWSIAVTADNTNKCLVVTVTGEAAKTIRWVGNIQTAEVSG